MFEYTLADSLEMGLKLTKHGITLTEYNNMLPWQRTAFVMLVLKQIEEDKARMNADKP